MIKRNAGDRTDRKQDAIDRLEPDLMFLIRLLSVNYRRRGYPVERSQYLLLVQLEDGEKSTGEIAEILGLDHSTVVRQVTAIEKLGLAQRTPHPRDRRSVLVRISPQGLATIADMRQRRCDRLRAILVDWTEAEREQFGVLLHRFNVALVTLDDAERAGQEVS